MADDFVSTVPDQSPHAFVPHIDTAKCVTPKNTWCWTLAVLFFSFQHMCIPPARFTWRYLLSWREIPYHYYVSSLATFQVSPAHTFSNLLPNPGCGYIAVISSSIYPSLLILSFNFINIVMLEAVSKSGKTISTVCLLYTLMEDW